jgi:hypothetical protein
VVVAVGLTDCVPPVGCRVYELPSLPVTVTAVALVAVMVSMEELPDVMEIGLARIFTVGAGLGVTVTVAVAEVFPPVPVAVAVYVVVVVGLTGWVPPLACRVYELPSLPVTVTRVAFDAATVNMDVLPLATDVGLAAMFTVGAAVVAPGIAFWQPVTTKRSDRQQNKTIGRR